MTLRFLLGMRAALTFAAGVVLVIAPALIPGAVGIHFEPPAYLLCYLLAAAEFSLAVLSWAGTDDHRREGCPKHRPRVERVACDPWALGDLGLSVRHGEQSRVG
jgi:hypothetical protein